MDEELELFCMSYSKCFRSGMAMAEVKPHLTDGSARSMGCEAMRLPSVKDRIAYLIEERKKRMEIDGDLILHEINLLANADIACILDENGFPDLKKIKEAPPEVTRCIESIKVSKDGVTVKFHSKTKALELGGKAKRLFVDRTQLEGPDGEAIKPVSFEVNFLSPKKKDEPDRLSDEKPRQD